MILIALLIMLFAASIGKKNGLTNQQIAKSFLFALIVSLILLGVYK